MSRVMKRIKSVGSLGILIWLCVVCLPHSVIAVLGEVEKSIDQDELSIPSSKGLSRKVGKTAGYRIHELSSDSHTIREYINSQGVVFGVTWRGPTQPDLSILLGSHYKEAQEAFGRTPNQDSPKGRVPIKENLSRAVVEQGGHMRDVHGKAYLPDLLPEGVKPEDLP